MVLSNYKGSKERGISTAMRWRLAVEGGVM